MKRLFRSFLLPRLWIGRVTTLDGPTFPESSDLKRRQHQARDILTARRRHVDLFGKYPEPEPSGENVVVLREKSLGQ